MTITQRRVFSGAILTVFTLIAVVPFALAQDPVHGSDRVWGDRYKISAQARILARKPGPHGENPLERLKHWNEIAINATGLDHTPLAPGEDRIFGQQLGPGRASRAMAIVHIAIFEAINAIDGDYESYAGLRPVHGHMSMDAAIAKAACDTLSALFSSQSASFQQLLDDDMNEIPNGPAKDKGFDLGRKAAAAVLAMRVTDGSLQPELLYGTGYIASDQPGFWRQDPISHLPVVLGVHWGDVQPFVLQSTSQFRVPPPPALASAEYATAYNEVKRFGGDGIHTPTERTPEQTEIGLFWAYDGTPSLCAPPRLYNQITMKIAGLKHSDVVATARLLALVNTALADAGTSSWESKFYYNFWRPITGIRESDTGSGTSLLGDGNSATIGDPNFWPLGAPASNLTGPNFTPPFPAYPSGHATFGGALFETLRNFYHTDHIAFDFMSDEFNGVTVDSGGNVRELRSRHFATLSQAEDENGQSRIYLGIHWSFDKTAGIAQGRKVADYVFSHAFTPRNGRD